MQGYKDKVGLVKGKDIQARQRLPDSVLTLQTPKLYPITCSRTRVSTSDEPCRNRLLQAISAIEQRAGPVDPSRKGYFAAAVTAPQREPWARLALRREVTHRRHKRQDVASAGARNIEESREKASVSQQQQQQKNAQESMAGRTKA